MCEFICLYTHIHAYHINSNEYIHTHAYPHTDGRYGRGGVRTSVGQGLNCCKRLNWRVCDVFFLHVCSVLLYVQCVAVCCSVLQCVAMWCSVLQRVTACCSVLQCVVVCCSVCSVFEDNFIGMFVMHLSSVVAVCCSVLQCVAVCCSAA